MLGQVETAGTWKTQVQFFIYGEILMHIYMHITLRLELRGFQITYLLVHNHMKPTRRRYQRVRKLEFASFRTTMLYATLNNY